MVSFKPPTQEVLTSHRCTVYQPVSGLALRLIEADLDHNNESKCTKKWLDSYGASINHRQCNLPVDIGG